MRVTTVLLTYLLAYLLTYLLTCLLAYLLTSWPRGCAPPPSAPTVRMLTQRPATSASQLAIMAVASAPSAVQQRSACLRHTHSSCPCSCCACTYAHVSAAGGVQQTRALPAPTDSANRHSARTQLCIECMHIRDCMRGVGLWHVRWYIRV